MYTWFQLHLGDVQNLAVSTLEIDNPLVDSHLEPVPGFRTFTTWSFSGGDPHSPGWHGSWPLDLDSVAGFRFVEPFGTANDLSACFVNGRSVLSRDGDPDVVDFGLFGDLAVFFKGHFLQVFI